MRPSKTARKSAVTVIFPLTERTRELLDSHVRAGGLTSEAYLFSRLYNVGAEDKPISLRAYQNLVKQWVSKIGLDPNDYGTHSLRRSRPAHLYEQTGNLRACQIMLGHNSIASIQKYLGIEEAETLSLARRYEL